MNSWTQLSFQMDCSMIMNEREIHLCCWKLESCKPDKKPFGYNCGVSQYEAMSEFRVKGSSVPSSGSQQPTGWLVASCRRREGMETRISSWTALMSELGCWESKSRRGEEEDLLYHRNLVLQKGAKTTGLLQADRTARTWHAMPHQIGMSVHW